MKLGVAKILIDMNSSPTSDNIMYDSKFVSILVSMIIGDENLKNNNIDKQKMAFIKRKLTKSTDHMKLSKTFFTFPEAFVNRTGTKNPIRLFRFPEYIEKRKMKILLQKK